ncbi:MAG: ExeM/NucH family extracellular endonuclease [bacterium]|nr:ExeM/NucH family extracellular endonuclease [bacterium]
MSLNDPANDNNDGANWCEASTAYGDGDFGTPGAANDCAAPPVEITKIHTIQGSESASSLVGSLVTIEGVVVGDFQDAGLGANGDLNGFFVQEEDADTDADPATSEGILVFDGNTPSVDVAVGDLVRVTGEVTEYYDMTEITNVSTVEVIGTGIASPATITLPWASEIEPEQYEGMLVDFPQTLFASGNYNQGRYGEVDLSIGGPLDNPTNVAAPGADALAVRAQNNLRRIQLDDGSSEQNPQPLPPYIGSDTTLRTGDTVTGLTAVMNYGYGSYELHPTEAVSFTRVNDRPASPPDVGGTLTVAAYNVLNYFTTLDGGVPICGPVGGHDCRGADNATEFERQRDKIVNALALMDADIVGLIEIENHATDAALADLVNGVNDVVGAGTYDYVPTGPIGTDAIKVALIYKPAAVSLAGVHAILDSSVDPAFIDTKNRPVLAQTFMDLGSGELVTVAVNHLKSKGSDCDALDDPDTGDMQGNCNLTRTSAATALVNWLGTDPTGSGSDNFLITGDLNAYAMEDPISAIKGAGYTDLIAALVGSGFADGAYSYNYFSESGYLDHALASSGLFSQVTGVGVWHTNADEPSALNYNDYNQPALYDAGPYRASDHDPVIVGLELTPTPPVVSAAFIKIWRSYTTGLFKVDFSCVDLVDPDPDCVADINGITVEDGQKVFLIKSRWGSPWSKMIGNTLFIKDRDFTLTVTGTDQVGNEATATAEPAFRKWRRWSVN